LSGQSIRDLEERRSKTLQEISYVDNLLKQTELKKNAGLSDLRIIGSRLTLREQLISGMNEEISLLRERVEINSLAIKLMEEDLIKLKGDYASKIVNLWKLKKSTPQLAFIMSARDFNQGYKRIKYLQQITDFRREETEIIFEIMSQIEKVKADIQKDISGVSEIRSNEEKQREILSQERERKRKIVNALSTKEKQLKQELEDKKRAAQRIQSEINRLIDEERRKSKVSPMTPEMKLIGDNFADNKGRLPWPVEKGLITSKFGEQQHPDLKYVKENNIGIEITSENRTIVRSVFKGQVVGLFAIPGYNMSVIIRHGKYLSVYQNIVNLKVKNGDMVETRQEIAEVFMDKEKGSISVLKFMVFNEKDMQDPELWLAKRR
jgi:septal ring factor EnvC (AmiA/AmiB activator)